MPKIHAPVTATSLLRPGLLDGRRLVLAGPAGAPAASAEPGAGPVGSQSAETGGAPVGWSTAVRAACEDLGAVVHHLAADPADDHGAASAATALATAGPIDGVIVDAAALFASGGDPTGVDDGVATLRASVDGAWTATRAVVNAAFIPGERGGRAILLAPRPGAGTHAPAAAAALENLARTLSIEWARFQVTVVAVAPGDTTAAEEVGALVAFLASTAGAYYSGCVLDLRGPRA